jgi:4-amino-4-deoxy-L-arabinose transferase-like glycosyltransferase
MAKGLVPAAVAGIPIGVVTLREQGWRGVRVLRPLLGAVIVGAIVLPWHALVAWRHPGFAWDYVVHQHLLVFLGRKPTLDAVGDPLLPFWGAAVFRAIPWVLVLPCTFADLRPHRRGTAPGRATSLLWTWLGATMLFFSLTPSRLEHYAIPTLPAVALLAARGWLRLRDGEVGRFGWLAVGLAGGVVVAVGLGLAATGPALLAQRYWLEQAPVIRDLVAPAGWVLVAGGGLIALAAAHRRATALVAGLVAAVVPLGAIVVRAEVAVEPLFSWAPVAAVLGRQVPPEVEVVFESPQEYQLVAGLAFYARRRITLLEPVGYTAPVYLARLDHSIFLSRPEFERRWRAGEPLVLVSDPLQRRDSPEGIVPGTYTALARFGDRWVLRNGLAPSSG